jgi:hypothetical protein
MPKFVIDEDMPRSTAKVLKSRGYEVLDVRDYGLRGSSLILLREHKQILKGIQIIPL